MPLGDQGINYMSFRSITTYASLLAVSLASAACSSTSLPAFTAEASSLSTERDWSSFPLGANDVLFVGVHGHPELSTPMSGERIGTRVDPSGELSLPLVGAIEVGGLDLAEARQRIAAAYEAYMLDPKVDVSVVEYGARRFYLYGEVQDAGAYVIDRPLSIYQGLALGGGFTRGADRERIVLLRGSSPDDLEVHLIDGASPKASGMHGLIPEDLLFVRRSGAGRFADEILPVLQGISSSLGSVATVLLIEDRLKK